MEELMMEKYKIVGVMVPTNAGLTKRAACMLMKHFDGEEMDVLRIDGTANSAAYLLIDSNLWTEEFHESPEKLQELLTPFLNDWSKESANGVYLLDHDIRVMLYSSETDLTYKTELDVMCF